MRKFIVWHPDSPGVALEVWRPWWLWWWRGEYATRGEAITAEMKPIDKRGM